jgi:hypothetical protein
VYSCLHVHVLMKRSLIKIRHNNLSDRRVGIRKAARARYPCAPAGGLRTVAGWLRTRVKVARVVGASASLVATTRLKTASTLKLYQMSLRACARVFAHFRLRWALGRWR